MRIPTVYEVPIYFYIPLNEINISPKVYNSPSATRKTLFKILYYRNSP